MSLVETSPAEAATALLSYDQVDTIAGEIAIEVDLSLLPADKPFTAQFELNS